MGLVSTTNPAPYDRYLDNEPPPSEMSPDDIREASDAAFLRHEAREFVDHHDLEDIDDALADPKRTALILWLAQAFVAGGHEDESAFSEARALAGGFAATVRESEWLAERRREEEGREWSEADIDTVRAPGAGHATSDFSNGKAA